MWQWKLSPDIAKCPWRRGTTPVPSWEPLFYTRDGFRRGLGGAWHPGVWNTARCSIRWTFTLFLSQPHAPSPPPSPPSKAGLLLMSKCSVRTRSPWTHPSSPDNPEPRRRSKPDQRNRLCDQIPAAGPPLRLGLLWSEGPGHKHLSDVVLSGWA